MTEEYINSKKSKVRCLLEAHGYRFGFYENNIQCLIKTEEQYIKDHKLTNVPAEKAVEEYMNHRYEDNVIYSKPNERFSVWMQRLGWLKKDKSGVLIPDVELVGY